MPTAPGNYELSMGDDLGHDAIPVCCDEEMTAVDRKRGYRDYTCGDCGTVLILAPSGLVFDIED